APTYTAPTYAVPADPAPTHATPAYSAPAYAVPANAAAPASAPYHPLRGFCLGCSLNNHSTVGGTGKR
ncbi:MAG TPA: hypothetical protein VEK55_11570, partial [Xanthobacteraceae bacterium]|nr:hypothetical protein [Xanthobacteraceae bacterium]